MARNRSLLLAAGALAVLLAASCSGQHSERPQHRAIFSPNGEPLAGGPLGFPTCAVALGGWFDRLDAAHKGYIDGATFMADARRQFKAMDLDGDGIITPDVLLRYRKAYAVASLPPRASDEERDTADRDKAGHPGHEGRTGGRAKDQGSVDTTRDVPDPVMAADTSLRLRVSEADFMRHAEKVFNSLNIKGDGRLSRAEAIGWCGEAEPAESGGGGSWLGWF